MRAEFSKSIRRKAYERAGGFCERCGATLRVSPEYHHRIEAYLGGDNSLENCACVCPPCHRELTAERHPAIDKTRRLADKRMGIRKRKSSLSSGRYKRKLDGSTVLRDGK